MSNSKMFLSALRTTGIIEGISFLILLGIAMPMKYVFGQPEMVRYVGSLHGVLTILYILLLISVSLRMRWSIKTTALAFIASLIPFGMLYAEFNIFRKAVQS
jgi:integral membrane protein